MRMFPTIRGRSLEQRELTLPRDLPGVLTCVVVAFRQHQQRDVDTWLELLRELAGEHLNFDFCELPSLAGRWRPARAFIDGGMSRAIDDQSVRERTITSYGYVAQLVAGLELASTDAIAVVLVARDGTIHWQGLGPHDPNAGKQLAKAVRAVL